jgi:hypothetical protein
MEETIDIPTEEVKEPVAPTAPIVKTGYFLEPELHAAIIAYLKTDTIEKGLNLYLPLMRLSTVTVTFPGK